jgi:DNA-binding beta-propeller fold protein YncE
VGLAYGALRTLAPIQMGKQPDGTYIVATGQHIGAPAIRFKGRPSDLVLRPQGDLFAVLNKSSVFLCRTDGVIQGTEVPLGTDAGFRGLAWTPDGKRLLATTADGPIATFDYDGAKLTAGPKIDIGNGKRNPVPGGMAITKDGTRLYVTAADLEQAVEVDLPSGRVLRRFPVENVAFGCRLSDDERTLIVSNWGGRLAKAGDETSKSEDKDIVVDKRGVPSTGSVSLIDLSTGTTTNVPAGVHPSDICVAGNRAFVADTMADEISEIDLTTKRVKRKVPIKWGKLRVLGAMPTALAVEGDTLYACDGGDNALAEVDLKSGKVRGFRPVGFYPIALFVQDGKAVVLNSKGNGSVANTAYGRIGNAHDFEGSISVLDLGSDLEKDTAQVAANNRWGEAFPRPKLRVYNGAIKHVVYIIKENRTYDEIYGDMPEGNGDPSLCQIGERIMPNHRALAREFGLFDNAYVSGTNSNDGHAWSTQALANDYQEHFYVGYSRTYNDDGNCSMSLSTGGALWDAARKKGISLRDYGEFVVASDAEFQPRQPKDWFEAWKDREEKTHVFTYVPHCRVPSLRPYVHPTVHYWPLIQSDQSRADEFIKDYHARLANDTVPALTILSLPCDHTEGTDPKYPKPESMMADNDLALGRVVEAISKGPQWKETCIFVIEDDAQSGPDHVDGHRTSVLVISPYNRRRAVNHEFVTTLSMIRSIELMLGLAPMNRFDALADPIQSPFTDTLDPTPYIAKPANIPLDQRNPVPSSRMTPQERFLMAKTRSLDWSHPDAPDAYWLNRITWASLHPAGTPYPARSTDHPSEPDE